MNIEDSFVLFSSGLAVWIVGTIYFAYRGAAVLEAGSLHYWISFVATPVISAAFCIAFLRWKHLPASAWASGMLLLAIPGMIGEALVLSHFSIFMPRLEQASAGRYGALLFASYAVALSVAEVVTLRAAQ